MASKCRVALVEPPRAIVTVIASSKVHVSKYQTASAPFSAFSQQHDQLLRYPLACPWTQQGEKRSLAAHTRNFIAVAIVLAVYIPPQPPGPGHALHSMRRTSSLSSRHDSIFRFLQDRNQVNVLAVQIPRRNRSAVGKDSRNIHVSNGNHGAWHILSQPPMATKASTLCPPMAASMESAMISREVREKRMPGVPMAIPSATVIVPYWTGQAPSALMPSLASLPNHAMDVTVYFRPMEITPTIGVSKSLSVIPVARSMARLGDLTILS